MTINLVQGNYREILFTEIEEQRDNDTIMCESELVDSEWQVPPYLEYCTDIGTLNH
jgi:hypothetical protein